MNFPDKLFAVDCSVTCADGTEEKNVLAFLENNKKVYKTKEGVELTGGKAPSSVDISGVLISPIELAYINRQCEEKG